MQRTQSLIKPSLKLAGGGVVLLLAGCGMGMDDATDYRSRTFTSNGEQIYFTGRSQSGTAITSQGGTMHAQMHNTACVSCHGENRQGKRFYPTFWIVAPPLTRVALTEEYDDGHGDHQRYDEKSLKQAISKGLDPAGKELNSVMPRWRMSEGDMNDLTRFLMSDHDAL